MVNIEVTSRIPAIFEITTHELNTGESLKENVYFYKRDVLMSLEDCSVKATYVIDGTLIAEDIAQKVVGNSYVDFDLTSSEHVQLIPGEMLVEFNIIDNETGANLCPATALIVLVKSSIKDDARITDNSYGTTAEILREVALARGNFNTLGDRLDDVDSDIAALDQSKLTFTVLPTSSTYSESVFSNNQAIGTMYGVYMAGTAYWFFNAKVGQDITLQYRFSKNGIEIKGGSMTEWLNIGGKGDEIVNARGTFANLAARLNDMTTRLDDMATNIWQNSRAINQTIPDELSKKLNCKQATSFDNNLNLKTLYYIGSGLNIFYFLNLDDSTQLRYNANLGFELREKTNDTWGDWAPAIADGSISNDMLNSALQSAIVRANRSMQYNFLGNAEPSEFNSIFEDNRNKDTIYRAGVGSYYYDFINLSSDIQLRMSKAGIEVKNYSAATPEWTFLVKSDDRDKLLKMWADFDTKDYLDVVDLGELGETTSLDNEDYCLQWRRYLFKAVNNLTGILHVPANTVCVLTNADGYQIVEPVNIAVKIIRKVNAVRPTFNADPWEFITKTLNSGEVLWDNLAAAVKTRITDLESGKADYVNLSEDPFTTAADFKDYDFQSDKCYQVFLYAGILGTYEPAQVALVFESDWQTRIILGAKSGVFYSTYDSQTEEWSDPVKSLDKATERQLNNFEQRISALETANTILSNAINGVVSE